MSTPEGGGKKWYMAGQMLKIFELTLSLKLLQLNHILLNKHRVW